MRIEGAYTIPAPIEQVFAAFTHPDLLGQIIPGCERLIQFGPAADGEPSVYEVRLRRGPGADVYTMTLTLNATHATHTTHATQPAQSPTHLRADLDGRGPDGPFSGTGQVDLAAHDGATRVTYAWEVKSPVLAGLPAERETTWNDEASRFASALRDRASSVIHGAASTSALAGGVRHLTTPRGRVVILPRSDRMLASPQARRFVWLGGGLLAGLAVGAALFAIIRRVRRGGADSMSDSSE